MSSPSPDSADHPYEPRPATRWAWAAGAVVACVAVGLLARWVVGALVSGRLPYLTFFPAVITAALIAGWRAGAAATVLAAVASVYWNTPSGGSRIQTYEDAIGLCLFVLTCVYITAVVEWMIRARQREVEAVQSGRRADRRLREFVENVSDGFAAFDADWTIEYINAAGSALVGRRPDELVGRNHWEVFPDARGTAIEAEYRRAVADRVPFRLTTFFPPHDRWYEISGYPTENGLSVFFVDVSRRMRDDLARRAADETFRAAVDAGQIGIWDWDIAADRVTWSDRVYEMHGVRRGEFAGTADAFLRLVHPDDLPGMRKLMAEAMARRAPYVAEFRAMVPGGPVRWLQTHGRVLFDDAGEPVRLLGATVDVTERRRVDEEKNRVLADERAARSQAEHASRMKDEFLATLSHELRTPLNAILGWAQLLRRGANDPAHADDLAQGLETIERNARAQTQLIEDLLDMSRVVAGKLRLDTRPVDLPDVVDAAIATVAPAADAKGIRIDKVLDPRAGPVSGDPARLQQAVWNLLSNAIKFTPKGGRVQVMLARVNSHVEVTFADTGEGIDADFLPYVFDRFRQADGSTTRRFSGLGLGLSIVKNLIEMHGGSVRAASPGPGRGSTFTLELPVTVVHRADDEREYADGDHGGGDGAGNGDGRDAAHYVASASLAGLNVLVVDDEPDARLLITRVLRDCGATVVEAGGAGEGLRALGAFRPDVIVSDIGMPEVDGYEFITRVRARGDGAAGARAPAIALTAFARSEDRTRALLAGYLVHVAKPVEPAELVATVAAVAGRTGLPKDADPTRGDSSTPGSER
jgi:PAS domain S-box-containing protein